MIFTDILRSQRLPMLLQTEMAECGLASLAMVAAFHGHHVDLNGLRQRFSLSLKGSTLRDIMSMADALGFSTRALRLETIHLSSLRAPSILHWDLNHFVVFREMRRGNAIIHDPARGIRELSPTELSKHFTGVALEITPSADFKPKEIQLSARLGDLWSRVIGWRRSAGQTLLLSGFLQIFALISPLFFQSVIDDVLPRGDTELLFTLALAFGALYSLTALTESLRAWVVLLLGQTLTFQIVGNLLRHLLRLPTNFFEKRYVGDVLSRMGSSRQIQKVLTQDVATSIIDSVMAVITGFLLFVYSAPLASIVLGFTTAYIGIAFAIYPYRRNAEEEELIARAEEQSHLIESIQASRTIKLFGREAEREGQWRNFFARVINANARVASADSLVKAFQTFLLGIQLVLVVYLGARMIIAGEFTVGMLFAVLFYRQNFCDRAAALVDKGTQFRLISLHLTRLADIVKAEREEGVEAPIFDTPQDGRIQLSGVKFRYAANEPYILNDVSITIEPGEFVAIIGPSGQGKTTLLKLILGLYAPNEGTVNVNGMPLRVFGHRQWRSRTGVVQQDDRLLAGTIADNIAFFDSELKMDRVLTCAKTARVHDEIAKMPMKFLSLVGDMGSTLSGGQRQRVLLARALYRNPDVLFLDEGTANLDLDTEREIADVIEGMNITRVVIAHRPELIARADRVFVLRDGRLEQAEQPGGAAPSVKGNLPSAGVTA